MLAEKSHIPKYQKKIVEIQNLSCIKFIFFSQQHIRKILRHVDFVKC